MDDPVQSSTERAINSREVCHVLRQIFMPKNRYREPYVLKFFHRAAIKLLFNSSLLSTSYPPPNEDRKHVVIFTFMQLQQHRRNVKKMSA